MIDAESITITKGPSRELLFDALKYAYDPDNPHTVTFYGAYRGDITAIETPGHELNMRIIGICHEDGSGESFNLQGYALNWPRHAGVLLKFYYDARKREGFVWMSLKT